MNRLADIQIALDERGLRAAGRNLSIFKLSGEALGMQDRPLFSDAMWQDLLCPIFSRRWQATRAVVDEIAPHVKLMLHSDGAIRTFLPDLIEVIRALAPGGGFILAPVHNVQADVASENIVAMCRPAQEAGQYPTS